MDTGRASGAREPRGKAGNPADGDEITRRRTARGERPRDRHDRPAGEELGTDPAKAVEVYKSMVDPLVDDPAKTDDPRGLSYGDAVIGTSSSTVNEDTQFNLGQNIGVTLADTDGSQSLSVTLTGVPDPVGTECYSCRLTRGSATPDRCPCPHRWR